jgi:hypothetical protein
MSEEKVLQPECYKRHAEIEGHIKEGRFWRGVIVTVAVAGTGILIGQYNMSIQNNDRIIALTSELKTIATANVKRLDRIEDMVFYYKGEKGAAGPAGATGAQGIQGVAGKDMTESGMRLGR